MLYTCLMHILKTIGRIILLIIIACIVGAVLFYVNKKTPGKPSLPKPAGQAPVVIETIREQASTTPQVTVEYPQFPSLAEDFNATIKTSVMTRLAAFRQESAEAYQARKTTAPTDQYITPSDFNFIARWEPAQANARYVSFIIRFDSYTGGANENQELQTFNYDVKMGKLLSISDIASRSDYLQVLSREARSQLAAHFKEVAGANAPLDQMTASTTPEGGNFQNFTFTEKSVTIYFPKYSVAPGAFGEQKITIPLKEIQ